MIYTQIQSINIRYIKYRMRIINVSQRIKSISITFIDFKKCNVWENYDSSNKHLVKVLQISKSFFAHVVYFS